MATGNSAMVLVTGTGWTRGLRNLLRAELAEWFGTRMWWGQILIWAASINLIFLMVSLSARNAPAIESIMIFNIFMGLAGPIGTSIVLQSAVVGEKRSGTAAWLLSKPVSRSGFIVAKLAGNAVGLAATMVLAQGVIAYLIAGLVLNSWLPVPGFLAALGIHMLHILFYLTLTLMLGAIFEHPAPVIGIPMAFLFAQQFLMSALARLWAPLAQALPWNLAIPANNSNAPSAAMALMAGQPVPTYLPVVTTAGLALLFAAIALWAFQRQEL